MGFSISKVNFLLKKNMNTHDQGSTLVKGRVSRLLLVPLKKMVLVNREKSLAEK